VSAAAPVGHGEPRVGRALYLALLGMLALYGIAWITLGPLPQDPAYHLLADTRTCLGIPRAGDVLTNFAILGAGLFGLVLHPGMNTSHEEQPAVALLIAGTFLTAAGSAYYHWAPSNATLFWDRLPMMLTIPPILVLVLADRVHPAFARKALVPITAFAVGSVLWWAASQALGREDVRLYLMVRVLMAATLLALVVFRPGRHSGTGWLVGALVAEGVLTLFERLDHEIFRWTGGLASGHNLKHAMVGVALVCVFCWLRYRRRRLVVGSASAPERHPRTRERG
jgi:uncharacterized membrane protein YidH (DUF202 family)